ncbi:hypothetical protein [Saccharopolyspora elongata]|uniref:Uncharacterized protein n=1 Tax=Saccharopolyspora elongata TaxID=2530387 RepID=A0A4R4Y1U8_9PSEU|nr:hypothetical protein [Saccharopolyspora elongata]TDD37369.1 hypothetical protein E1288_40570 [Saccharopolyspora elongata]
MNKSTSDPGTPIFGELNKELGELPEIEVREFDSYGFDFSKDTSGKPAVQEMVEDSTGNAGGESTSKSAKAAGGRRRRTEP